MQLPIPIYLYVYLNIILVIFSCNNCIAVQKIFFSTCTKWGLRHCFLSRVCLASSIPLSSCSVPDFEHAKIRPAANQAFHLYCTSALPPAYYFCRYSPSLLKGHPFPPWTCCCSQSSHWLTLLHCPLLLWLLCRMEQTACPHSGRLVWSWRQAHPKGHASYRWDFYLGDGGSKNGFLQLDPFFIFKEVFSKHVKKIAGEFHLPDVPRARIDRGHN